MGSKKFVVVNKYRFVLSISFLLFLLFFIIGIACNSFDVMGEEISDYVMIEVELGDTVWDIAKEINEEFFDHKMDTRKISYAISQENNLENYFIYPGQKLLIPVN